MKPPIFVSSAAAAIPAKAIARPISGSIAGIGVSAETLNNQGQRASDCARICVL